MFPSIRDLIKLEFYKNRSLAELHVIVINAVEILSLEPITYDVHNTKIVLKVDQWEGMASKGNIVARDESLGYIGWLLTELRMKDNVVGAGSCMIFPRSLFDKVGGFATVRQGYDAVFQRAVMDKGYTVKNADPFNFIYTRGRPEGNTWNPGRTGIRHNNITLEEVILTV